MKGRSSPDQITYSERGNLQGAQFYAVAGKVYELAKRSRTRARDSDRMVSAGHSRLEYCGPFQDVQPGLSAFKIVCPEFIEGFNPPATSG